MKVSNKSKSKCFLYLEKRSVRGEIKESLNQIIGVFKIEMYGFSSLSGSGKKNKIDKEKNKKTVCLNKRVMEYSVPIRE